MYTSYAKILKIMEDRNKFTDKYCKYTEKEKIAMFIKLGIPDEQSKALVEYLARMHFSPDMAVIMIKQMIHSLN